MLSIARLNLRSLAALLILPLCCVAPAWVPGRAFLPQTPALYAPWAQQGEHAGANRLASDRLSPALTDELAYHALARRGELPSWNPLLGAGVPLAAGSVHGAWYPPRALVYVLDPLRASAWLALSTLFLAGLGLFLFLTRRGLSTSSALCGAWCLQAASFALVNLHYPMKLDAALWLPWSWWAIEGLARSARRAGPALALAVGLSLLAGFVPIACFALAAAALFALARAVEPELAGQRARFLARCAGWLGVGVLLGAAQWLPMQAAMRASLRAPQGADELVAQRLPWGALGTLFVPELFGAAQDPEPGPANPVAWALASAGERDLAASANALEWNGSLGLAALVLLAAACARPRAAWFPLALFAASWAFAQGWPGVRLLYAVPGLDLGAPGRALALAWCAGAWLAALGAEALSTGQARARVAALATAGLAAALGLALWLGAASGLPRALAAAAERFGADAATLARHAPAELVERSVQRLAQGGLALALLAAAAGAFVIAARKLPVAARAAAVLVLAGAQAWWVGRDHLAPQTLADGRLYPDDDRLDALRAAVGDGRVVRLDESASGLDDVVQLARPNLLQPLGVADLTPYVIFPPRELVELLERLDPRSRLRVGASRISDAALLDHPLLDLLRVRAVLARRALADPALEPVAARDGFHVYRRAGALPVARVVPALRQVDDVPAELARRAHDPRAAALVDFAPEGAGAPSAGPADSSAFVAGELTVRRPGWDRLDVEVRGSSGGWLVMHEQHAPGWKAVVDGRDAPIVRVDHLYRAVRLPPGDALVRTKYEPWEARWGALASLAACAAVLFGLWRPRGAGGT